MKRLAALGCLGVRLALAAIGHADDAAALHAVAPSFDAGKVEAGTPVEHTYVLRNDGPKTLQVVAKPGCGCTTTSYDREIPPGGTGKVTARLDTTDLRGRVEKTIDIISNDPSGRALTLTLIADSQRALIVEPNDRPLLRGPIHRVSPAVVTVRAPDGAAFRITRVEDEAALRAKVVALDDAVKGAHRRYQVTLTPEANLAVGYHKPNVTLVTSLRKAPRFALQPTIVVVGPLVTMPQQLHVGPGVTTVGVRVTASDGAGFKVLRAECSDRDFTATIAAVADEPAWDVTVRYTGTPGRRRPVNGVLRIFTDAPSQPLVIVRLAGRL
jgi:hypothetical protein